MVAAGTMVVAGITVDGTVAAGGTNGATWVMAGGVAAGKGRRIEDGLSLFSFMRLIFYFSTPKRGWKPQVRIK
jgi:hypothetical protein